MYIYNSSIYLLKKIDVLNLNVITAFIFDVSHNNLFLTD